jgi:hypothetical protein
MASTAEPPDPMPCALASILLPESRVHGCHMKKGLFQGTYWVHAWTCVFGPFLRAGCAGAVWVRGRSLGSGMGAGRRCLTPHRGWASYVGRVPLAAARAHVVVVRAVAWGFGRRGVFPQCGVEYAWSLGLVRSLVVLSGFLRWLQSGA